MELLGDPKDSFFFCRQTAHVNVRDTFLDTPRSEPTFASQLGSRGRITISIVVNERSIQCLSNTSPLNEIPVSCFQLVSKYFQLLWQGMGWSQL